MLNIKNAEAHRMAREVADLTGESLTTAVIESLRERRDRLAKEQSREAKLERLLEIARQARMKLGEPWWREGEDPAAFLYDENGLPR